MNNNFTILGDFDNLSGAGKPLPERVVYNPYEDFTTHKMNQILVEGGFAPEWVMLKKDIDKMKTDLQQDLNKQCLKLITTASKYDRNHNDLMRKWVKHCEDNYFHGNNEDVKRLNKTIDDYNLQVPMLQSQMFHFNVKKESENVWKTHSALIMGMFIIKDTYSLVHISTYLLNQLFVYR